MAYKVSGGKGGEKWEPGGGGGSSRRREGRKEVGFRIPKLVGTGRNEKMFLQHCIIYCNKLYKKNGEAGARLKYKVWEGQSPGYSLRDLV